MNLVTIMNYRDPLGVTMCKGWIYLATRFCPDADITILHRDPIPEIAEYASRFGRIKIRAMSTDGVLAPEKSGTFGRPAQLFKLGLWKWAELAKMENFVFVDADAWIVRPIDTLFEASKSKVFVATTERARCGPLSGDDGPLLNTGVFAYSKGSKLQITYEKLAEEFELSGGKIPAPTGDQGLIWSLFRRIGYNWELPEIGQEYNTFANGIRTVKLGSSIEVYAADKPPSGIDRWASEWFGWGNREPARIVHAISQYKWWTLPETKSLWDHVCSEVSDPNGGKFRNDRNEDARPASRNPDRKYASWDISTASVFAEPSEKVRREVVPGLVSVVVPTYNRPELILHAIGLIRSQTHKNIEIIVVEDSEPKFRMHTIKAPDITHIQLNRRFSTGMKHNMALEAARGEWVCHWDDDDWYAKDRIERQIKAMSEAKAAVSGIRRDYVLSTDGSWWHIKVPPDDVSWLGNATCRAFYDFHDGTAIFRRDAVPKTADYGDHVVSQKVWLLNAILRSGAHWIDVPNDKLFVYVRHKKNVWSFDESKVREPADRPEWFPEHELQFYKELSQ